MLTRVGMIGLGRTGKVVARNIIEHPQLELVMAVVSPGGEKVGRDLGDLLGTSPQNLRVTGGNHLQTELMRTNPDIVVDFTNPGVCLKNARIISLNKKHLIIGTTGFSKEQIILLKQLAQAQKITIVYAPNLSLGINVLLSMVKKAVETLDKWDVEIIETHHRYKKDAPSGTAVRIAEEIAGWSGVPLETSVLYIRKGLSERMNGEITIHAIRGGGVIGIHEVVFLSDHEKITVRHESLSRDAFADCLVKVIHFVTHSQPGFYFVEKTLGLDEDNIIFEEDNLA